MPISGDVELNVGAYVRAILARPEISTPAKYAFVYTDLIRYDQILKIWTEVTGRRATYLECTDQQAAEIFSLFGVELATQFRMNKAQPDWTAAHKGDMIGSRELGIGDGELINFKGSLKKNKKKL